MQQFVMVIAALIIGAWLMHWFIDAGSWLLL